MIKLLEIPFNHKGVKAYTTPSYKENGELFNLNLHVEPTQTLINRQELLDTLNIDAKQAVIMNQVHSINFRKVTLEDGGCGILDLESAIFQTDAIYTRDKNLTLMTSHADCCPVLFYDYQTNLIAAIHSGWKGTVNEISSHLLKHLIKHEGVNPKTLEVYLGPSLSTKNFEAMDDIIDKVKNMSFDTSPFYKRKDESHYLLDSRSLIKTGLELLGVPSENIHQSRLCTYDDDRFFSYRKNKTPYRNYTLITLQ